MGADMSEPTTPVGGETHSRLERAERARHLPWPEGVREWDFASVVTADAIDPVETRRLLDEVEAEFQRRRL